MDFHLPAGMTLDDLSFEVISSSGVIAIQSFASTGARTLLLVPIGLRFLNGKTSRKGVSPCMCAEARECSQYICGLSTSRSA